MPETVIAELASHGILGVIVVVLGWAYHKQSTELKAVQEARVQDAKQVTDTVVGVVNEHNQTAAELTAAIVDLGHRLPRGD